MWGLCYIWRTLLHVVGLDYDVLVLGWYLGGLLLYMEVTFVGWWFGKCLPWRSLEACGATLGEALMMTWMLCYIGWWHGGLEHEELVLVRHFKAWTMWSLFWSWSWSLELEACSCSTYILLASWSLLPLTIGFLKPLLVGTKRRKLGLVQRVDALTLNWCWEDLRRLKSSASRQLIVSNGFYQWTYYWVFHLYLVYLVYMDDPLLLCIYD